jgi:hypothetical protein
MRGGTGGLQWDAELHYLRYLPRLQGGRAGRLQLRVGSTVTRKMRSDPSSAGGLTARAGR